jgi:hypothetical protein
MEVVPVVNVNAVGPMVQVDPSVQVTPFTVVEGFASAELGIAEAATASEGVVVGLVTVGTNHVGQDADGAEKLPTPEPVPENVQVVPVQLTPAPVNVNAPVVELIDATPPPVPQGAPEFRTLPAVSICRQSVPVPAAWFDIFRSENVPLPRVSMIWTELMDSEPKLPFRGRQLKPLLVLRKHLTGLPEVSETSARPEPAPVTAPYPVLLPRLAPAPF